MRRWLAVVAWLTTGEEFHSRVELMRDTSDDRMRAEGMHFHLTNQRQRINFN
jgi:hypothetical protein